MKRRIITTLLTLGLLLGGALWSAGRGVNAKTAATAVAAATYPLNPRQFTSLGASPFTTDGTYLINTSKDNPAPTLSGPGIVTPIAGVFFSPSGGTVARDEIAVFTFSSLTIPAGVTVEGMRNANSRPIALLSQSTATIDGTINVGGLDGAAGYQNRGKGGDAGPGGGGGGGGMFYPGNIGVGFVNGSVSYTGSNGGSVVAGGGGAIEATTGVVSGPGGAFGGNGGNSIGSSNNYFRTLAGTAYGDLSLTLQGGSGGSGGLDTTIDAIGPGGGGGGGAVEIGAVGHITLAGDVLANGGAGAISNRNGGGGGAGGGIVLHAPTVSLSGNLNALGGNARINTSGGGGGGRVLILTADGTLAGGSLDANVNVNGGTAYGGGGTGVKELKGTNQAPVAQSQNVTVAAGAACTANASIDNGSYDPDNGDTITVTQSPAGPYPLGTTNVTLTVTDSNGASSSAQATVTVVDQTAPTIAAGAKKADNTPYVAGTWTNQTVTVHFTCSDSCSGISACPADVVLASSGVTALVSGTATDGAGNTASTGFGPIWIDKMAPAVSVAGVANGATYPLGNVPAAACNTTDAHSGVAVAAALSLSGGNAQGVGAFTAACGSATDNVGNASAPVSVSYTVAYNLNKFVALAQEGVELDQRASVVSGDVGARIRANGPFLGDGVEVSIGQQVEMLSAASHLLGDSISIKQRATVYNPSYNDLDNNGTLLGTAATPLNLSLIPALPALPAIAPGAQNFEVAQQGTLTINAGSYGDLVVRQRATITFTGGVYHFRSWDVGQQVNLHFLAPSEIRIAGKLGVDQRSYLGPAPSAAGLTARDIVLYVAGQNGNSGTLGADPKAAAFGQETTLIANVVVPNGTLLLRQRTEATGAFFGKWFQAGQQVKLTLASRFGL